VDRTFSGHAVRARAQKWAKGEDSCCPQRSMRNLAAESFATGKPMPAFRHGPRIFHAFRNLVQPGGRKSPRCANGR
jgi:hypothetical protein